MKTRDFSKIFSAILILHLVVLFRPGPNAELLLLLSKILICFSLLAFFVHKTADIHWPSKHFIAAALLFSMIGDFVLEKEGETFFLMGMGIFALAHLFYSIFYIKNAAKFHWIILPILLIFPIAGIFLLKNLIEIPADFQTLIFSYSAFPALHFLVGSFFVLNDKKERWICLLGIILFIATDFWVAFNKFNDSNKYFEMLETVTYSGGQFLVVIGILEKFLLGKT